MLIEIPDNTLTFYVLLLYLDDDKAVFGFDNSEHRVTISRGDWEMVGRPSEITVPIVASRDYFRK